MVDFSFTLLLCLYVYNKIWCTSVSLLIGSSWRSSQGDIDSGGWRRSRAYVDCQSCVLCRICSCRLWGDYRQVSVDHFYSRYLNLCITVMFGREVILQYSYCFMHITEFHKPVTITFTDDHTTLYLKAWTHKRSHNDLTITAHLLMIFSRQDCYSMTY